MKLTVKKMALIIVSTLTLVIALASPVTYVSASNTNVNSINDKFLSKISSWDELVKKTSKLKNLSNEDTYYISLIANIDNDYSNRKTFPFTSFAELVAPDSLSSRQVRNVKTILRILNKSLDSQIPKGAHLKYDTWYDALNGYDYYAVATVDYWNEIKRFHYIGEHISFDGPLNEIKFYEVPNDGGSGNFGYISTNNPQLNGTSYKISVKNWDGTSETYNLPYTAYINGYAYLSNDGNVIDEYYIPFDDISEKTEIRKHPSQVHTLMYHICTKKSDLGWVNAKYVATDEVK